MPGACSLPRSVLPALALSVAAEGGSLRGSRALTQLAFTLVHDGHCADGWIAGNDTQQDSLQGCYEHCDANPLCGFFAYSGTGLGCALYTTAGGCPDDDQYADYNAYRIVRECLRADFSQENLDSVQARELVGTAIESGFIFSWLDDGFRKMVLTDPEGSTLKSGYVSDSFAAWTDPGLWTNNSGFYTLSNVRSCITALPYITGLQIENLWHTRTNVYCNNNYDTSGDYGHSPDFWTKEAAVRACLALGDKCVAITDYLCQEVRFGEGTGISWKVCTSEESYRPQTMRQWSSACVYEKPDDAATPGTAYEQVATNFTCADNPPNERTYGSIDHGTVGSLEECQAICDGQDECAYLTYYTAKFESRWGREYPDRGTCITCKFDGWRQRGHPFGQLYAKVNFRG